MSLVLPSKTRSLKGVWAPLTRQRLFSLYLEMRGYQRIELFFADRVDISDDEKALLIFMDYIGAGSQSTLEVYTRYLCKFLNFCQKSFVYVTVWDSDAFVKDLQGRGCSPSTLATVMGGIRSFFKRMVGLGFLQTNPTELVRIPKIHDSEKIANVLERALSFEEVERVVAYLKEKGSMRDLALFYVMARAGLRAEEACSLVWADMQFLQGKWALNILGKGRKRRVVVPSSETIRYLLVYRRVEFLVEEQVDHHPSIVAPLPIFSHFNDKSRRMSRQNINRIMARLVAKTGLRHFSPHDLRHTCFTHLGVHYKVPLSDIQRMAGHTAIATTTRYIDAGKVMSGAALAFDEPPGAKGE